MIWWIVALALVVLAVRTAISRSAEKLPAARIHKNNLPEFECVEVDIQAEPTIADIPEPANIVRIAQADEFNYYEIPDRTSNPGEWLSAGELTFIKVRTQLERPACPDCQMGTLTQGPSGGMAQNVRCNWGCCGSRFSDLGIFGWERLTTRCPHRCKDKVHDHATVDSVELKDTYTKMVNSYRKLTHLE